MSPDEGDTDRCTLVERKATTLAASIELCINGIFKVPLQVAIQSVSPENASYKPNIDKCTWPLLEKVRQLNDAKVCKIEN